MKVGVLCIGDELLKGAVINTNLGHIGNRLLEIGIFPEIAMEVPDRPEDVVAALGILVEKTDFIIVSGGLGPTADDLTKPSVAEFLGRPLELDEGAAKAVKDRWASMKRGTLPMNFLNQAMIPRGADVIPNRCGTAPGIFISTGAEDRFPGKRIAMLPGPPQELDPMFDERILPLVKDALDTRLHSRLFHIAGVGESRVEERMQKIIARLPELSVAYCAAPEFVKLFIISKSEKTVSDASAFILAEFSRELLAESSHTVAEEIVMLLGMKKASLSLAESCTGGLAAKLVTDVPGASDVFPGGIVCYSNGVKKNLLGVKEATLRTFGAVSAECASEMLSGLGGLFGTDGAIAITGIAGPGGGTPEKPVGLVFIGVRFRDRRHVGRYEFRGSREQIRARATAVAFNTLRCFLKGETSGGGSEGTDTGTCPRS